MKIFKINKKYGEKAKKFLRQKNWLDNSRILGKTQKFLLFPLTKNSNHKLILAKFPGTIESRSLELIKKKKGNLKDQLNKVIPAKDLEQVGRSFDVVGDIAVISVPKELKKLEKSIAWTLKRSHSNIKTVAKRAKKTSGMYRIRRITPIVGENISETVHKESGVQIKVDLNKAYFSPRLGNERLELARQVQEEEKVLVMFAGVGPFPLVIARHNPSARLWAVELNPAAFKLMEENIKLNHLDKKIKLLKGDVRKVVPKIKEKFNRIIMMLPMKAADYLDVAVKVAKKGTKIYVYGFAGERDFPKVKENIKYKLKQLKVNGKIIKVRKCGDYAPGVHRICTELIMN